MRRPGHRLGSPGLALGRPLGLLHRSSLATRVTVLTTVAVGLSVAVVALAVYLTVRVQMQSTLDESLLERAERAASGGALSELTANKVPSWALGAADVRILFINERREASSADSLPALRLGGPELAVAEGEEPRSLRTVDAGDERYRVVTVPTVEGEALVIAQSLQPQDRTLAKLGVVMLLVGAAGMLAAGLAGWWVARNGLRPVRRLTHSVEEIARTERLEPLAIEGHDEIARLAGAFNDMLIALAASRDRQRQLVGDAGHELRTPLTSLRTNIDLLIQAERPRQEGADALPAGAREELLEDVRAQAEELTTLVGDLVELAREEPAASVVEPLDLVDVVDRAVTRVRRRAPGKTFHTDTTSWWVVGDAAALERMVTNLLDNAAKWGTAEGTVRVVLHQGRLTIDDDGPGIAEEDRPHVFERFWRSLEARSMPGSGLGLAIVGQVVDRHAGRVEIETSAAGGARVAVYLPGTPRQPAATPPVAHADPLPEEPLPDDPRPHHPGGAAVTEPARAGAARPSSGTPHTPPPRST